jgi:hypothetical protein
MPLSKPGESSVKHSLLFVASIGLVTACGPDKAPETPASKPEASAPMVAPPPEAPVDAAAPAEAASPEAVASPGQGLVALETDLGSPSALLDFFGTASEAKVRTKLADFGIGFAENLDASMACPKNFDSSLRNAWYAIAGEYYFVDDAGRPSRAYAAYPPIAAEERIPSCQGDVGQWGDAADPSNDYDGGHLIGSQLGGFGARANMVPQDTNFNRGNWATIENRLAKCDSLAKGQLHYFVIVRYPDAETLIPDTFLMHIMNTENFEGVELEFENTDGGGSNGKTMKDAAVEFLKDLGCN